MDRLEDVVIITEVDDGPAFAGHIFRRAFGAEIPDFEHHVVAFVRPAEDLFVPANYVHLWLREDLGLIGGASTDGRAFARIDPGAAARIRAERVSRAQEGRQRFFLALQAFAERIAPFVQFLQRRGAFGHLAPETATRIRDAGGLYLQTLRWTFAKFADRCDAFFGYCGDPRAWEVDMQAGFEPTKHDKLIAHWHRPLPAARRDELVERVNAMGPF